jgi:hypothetical protein
MTQWNNDYWQDVLKIGQVITWPQVNNPWVDWYIDQLTWWFLQMYFARYRVPEQAGDFEKFVGSFSTNGIKTKNLCGAG